MPQQLKTYNQSKITTNELLWNPRVEENILKTILHWWNMLQITLNSSPKSMAVFLKPLPIFLKQFNSKLHFSWTQLLSGNSWWSFSRLITREGNTCSKKSKMHILRNNFNNFFFLRKMCTERSKQVDKSKRYAYKA